MQVLVTSPATVKCDECGFEQIIDTDFFEDDPCVYDHGDNAMGEEIDHFFVAEIGCEQCGNNLRIEVRCSEYPVGAFDNNIECESEGCEIVVEPTVDADYSGEIDEIDFYEPSYDDWLSIDAVVNDIERYQNDPDILKQITPTEFEEVVSKILEMHGYEIVEVTKPTRDGGKDIIAKYVGGWIPYIIYVECKQWNPSRKVGIDVIRKLSAVQRDRNINKSVVVTTSFFTKDAEEYAEEHEMTLFDWNKLKAWLQDAER